ncbi:MAG: cupin domain-containing protein [Candidatus Omnitrophica bacterium]|nr:cupin domain-containing protein [Candidatus Omnitrophota bacterium]
MSLNIGKRMRELRKKNGLTLNELSKKSGVALATLSRIETSKMTGTVHSHISVAKALGMTLPEFYSEMDRPMTMQKETDYADLFVHDEKTSSVILTKDIFNKKMLPALIKLKRGGRTHSEQIKKGTEKFLYVLDGKIEVVIGDERSTLEKGATLYFDASYLHHIRNLASGESRCLCVVTPVTL